PFPIWASNGQFFRAQTVLAAIVESIHTSLTVSGSAAKMPIARKHHRLRARPDAQLVEQIRRVIPDGLLADAKTIGDIGVAQPVDDQRQTLTLSRRKSTECRVFTLCALHMQEIKDNLPEAIPSRLLLQQNVVP